MGLKNNINLDEYFNKLILEETGDEDKERLQAYIRSSFRDKELDELMRQHWDGIVNKGLEKNDLFLQQLKTKIRERIFGAESIPKKTIRWKTTLTRIAAVLFIPLLISSVYLFYLFSQGDMPDRQNAMQQVFATPGSRVHFILPDSSEVWLNSGSTLEYPINMNRQKQRKVKLSGQGYFNVTHDIKHPFVVEAGELNIKVLGTSFDVSAYPNDPFINSTLEIGSIALLDSYGKEVARLNPGQKAILDKQSRKLFIENVDTRLITSWKDGKLIFKNTPLAEVTRQLERWFNCHISVSPQLFNSGILYTATIKDETLGEVLKMIEISTSVTTKVENRKVTIME